MVARLVQLAVLTPQWRSLDIRARVCRLLVRHFKRGCLCYMRLSELDILLFHSLMMYETSRGQTELTSIFQICLYHFNYHITKSQDIKNAKFQDKNNVRIYVFSQLRDP